MRRQIDMSFDTRMTPPCLDKMRTICLSISDRTSSGLTLALPRFCLRGRGARAPDGRIQEALSGKRKPLHSSVPEDAGLQIGHADRVRDRHNLSDTTQK